MSSTVEKASVVLADTYIAMYRILLGKWTLKVLQARALKEMRDMYWKWEQRLSLLYNGRKLGQIVFSLLCGKQNL